jgi:hypothetical protein
MRSVLGFVVAVSLAVGGMTAANLMAPELDSPALAQNAQKSKTASQKPRGQRRTAPQTTGFEHQQCTVQDPCSTRNQH